MTNVPAIVTVNNCKVGTSGFACLHVGVGARACPVFQSEPFSSVIRYRSLTVAAQNENLCYQPVTEPRA